MKGARQGETRHYTEEETLVHLLGEDGADAAVGAHVEACSSCGAVAAELREVLEAIAEWGVPEVPEEAWQARRSALLENLRREPVRSGAARFARALVLRLRGAWDYALENPLPALGYVAAAVAFASERTITVFRLDQILPRTSEVFEILRQLL